MQFGLGLVAWWEVGLGWLDLDLMSLIHYQARKFGSHSTVPELTVSILILSQGNKFLQISHHGKFRSIGGLRPRTGIPWTLVHNQRRS